MVIILTLGLTLAVAHAQEQPKGPAVENGSTVKLEYTLKDDAGKLIETNKGNDPLTYTQGQQELIPGLEKALNGMRVGDQKQVTVKPEEGYGPLDPAAQTEVPKTMLPPDSLKVGAELVARAPDGQPMFVRIKEIKEQTVIIDLNHPLAGKTLHFDVKVLGVDAPKR
jgi:FKBP-type peptidyl-prolyl cis-trans isomerase SlyD